MKQTAYVINLAHRTDRWNNMLQWWPEFNLVKHHGIVLPKVPDRKLNENLSEEAKQKIYWSINVDRRANGLGMTHMQLFRDAMERGDKTILILEDDAVPKPGWFERWTEAKEYLDNHLDDWDVFNGGAYNLQTAYDVVKLNKILFIDGDRACASHFMYFNMKAFEKFLKWEICKTPVDMFYCNAYEKVFKLYCAFPMLSIQDDGFSDIINENRDWAVTLQMNELNYKQHLGVLYDEFNHSLSQGQSS
jgi:GR25 family glycosyltransferase involved in LPS biosynthesis